MSSPHHRVKLRYPLEAFTLDAAFVLSARWTVLFGPSGSGKTTLLRAVAGLIRPEEATITRQDGSELIPLTETETSRHTFVPPHLRRTRYAPQRSALFPHLTVEQNVSYGNSASVREVMQLFGLEQLARKLPATLSGGERQRVNLARACAAECKLLLLDEPFAGLDAALRDDLLARLQPWLAQRGIPVLSVTHDVVEALQLEAEVIAISNGKVTVQGAAATVLAEERARLLAHLS